MRGPTSTRRQRLREESLTARSQTSTDGRPVCHTWRGWSPRLDLRQLPSGLRTALETPAESTDPPLKRSSDASSFEGRQSQSPAGATSCCPTMRRSAPTSRTRFTGRKTTSVGGAGEESNRPATTYSRNVGPSCPRSGSCEGYREGTQMERPKGPLGQMAMEGEVYRGRFGAPGEHQGMDHQHQEKASGGKGRGLARGSWRGRGRGRGRAGPPINVVSFVSLLGGRGDRLFFLSPFLYLFLCCFTSFLCLVGYGGKEKGLPY